LAQLPFDISFHILSLLDPGLFYFFEIKKKYFLVSFFFVVSLAQCSRVNKLWYYLCSHPELWRKLAQQKKWSFSSILLDQQQIKSHTNEQEKTQV